MTFHFPLPGTDFFILASQCGIVPDKAPISQMTMMISLNMWLADSTETHRHYARHLPFDTTVEAATCDGHR